MLDKQALKNKILKAIEDIRPESDEDEAAMEYEAELTYVLNTIDRGGSEYDIVSACEHVGVSIETGR
jgi:hypothetical protein